MIRRFHDSFFCRTSGCLQNNLSSTESGLLAGVASRCPLLPGVMYCLSGPEMRAPMVHVDVGHRWDRVAMDLLDMSVTTGVDRKGWVPVPHPGYHY